MSIGLLLAILFVIADYYYFSRKITTNNDTENHKNSSNSHKEALDNILSSWNHYAIEKAFNDAMRQFPEYESLFNKTCEDQINTLYRLTQSDPTARECAWDAIKAALARCTNASAVHEVKKEFNEVLYYCPEFITIFNTYLKKLSPKKKTGLFDKCQTIQEVKQRFRKLAFHNHPDRGGTKAAMQEILRQYEEALQKNEA